jgi:hypothetical protein
MTTTKTTTTNRGRKADELGHDSPAKIKEAWNEGYIAGMAKMEAEAKLKYDLGVMAGRTQVARELGDPSLVAPIIPKGEARGK